MYATFAESSSSDFSELLPYEVQYVRLLYVVFSITDFTSSMMHCVDVSPLLGFPWPYLTELRNALHRNFLPSCISTTCRTHVLMDTKAKDLSLESFVYSNVLSLLVQPLDLLSRDFHYS
jgi:hypothetical protein